MRGISIIRLTQKADECVRFWGGVFLYMYYDEALVALMTGSCILLHYALLIFFMLAATALGPAASWLNSLPFFGKWRTAKDNLVWICGRRSRGLGKYRKDIIIRAGISYLIFWGGRRVWYASLYALFIFIQTCRLAYYFRLQLRLDSGVEGIEVWCFCDLERLNEIGCEQL